jgi:hypothetical protein
MLMDIDDVSKSPTLYMTQLGELKSVQQGQPLL